MGERLTCVFWLFKPGLGVVTRSSFCREMPPLLGLGTIVGRLDSHEILQVEHQRSLRQRATHSAGCCSNCRALSGVSGDYPVFATISYSTLNARRMPVAVHWRFHSTFIVANSLPKRVTTARTLDHPLQGQKQLHQLLITKRMVF